MSNRTILVTGATGKQGGTVARLLLARGHKVKALTRKPESAAAQALHALGAELVTGNLDDRASIERALTGADAVFAMSTPFEAGEAVETQQGVNVADAARAAGTYLVYTSVGSADRQTGIPHFESKYLVEKHIRDIGAKAAILAPVYFMENAIVFGRDQLKNGVYATPLPLEKKLAQVALADIGACAVAALEHPERYAGTRHDLTSAEVSGADAIATLTQVTGRPFHYFQVPMAAIRSMSEDMAIMYEWFDRVGYHVDHAALERAFPEVKWTSFESWARQQDWASIFA